MSYLRVALKGIKSQIKIEWPRNKGEKDCRVHQSSNETRHVG